MKLKVFTNVKEVFNITKKQLKENFEMLLKIIAKPKFPIWSVICFIVIPLVFYGLCRIADMRTVLIKIGGMSRGWDLNYGYWHEKLPYFAASLFFFCTGFCIFLLILHWCLRYKENACFLYNRFAQLQWFFFAIYILVTFVAVLYHEPWHDELNAWGYAKIKSIPALWHEMRYEGHFLPWYLLLMPFAKLGFPPHTLCFVSWVIFSCAAFIFVKKAPLSVFAKVIVLMTSPFIFWYPAVGRPYVISVLCMFLIATLWGKPIKHPLFFGGLIALLANSHAYLEGLVGIISLVFFIEEVVIPWKTYNKKQKKDHIISIAIILLGVLIASMQVVPAFWSASYVNAKRIFAPSWHDCWSFVYGSKIPGVMIKPFFYVLALLEIYLFIKNKRSFFIFTVAGFYMILFCAVLWKADIINRAVLWLFLIIFVIWIADTISIRMKSIILVIFSLFVLNWREMILDHKLKYSGIQPVCEVIHRYPKDTPIFTIVDFMPLHAYANEYTQYRWEDISKYMQENKNKENKAMLVLIITNLWSNSLYNIVPNIDSYPNAEYVGLSGLRYRLYEMQIPSE